MCMKIWILHICNVCWSRPCSVCCIMTHITFDCLQKESSGRSWVWLRFVSSIVPFLRTNTMPLKYCSTARSKYWNLSFHHSVQRLPATVPLATIYCSSHAGRWRFVDYIKHAGIVVCINPITRDQCIYGLLQLDYGYFIPNLSRIWRVY